MDIDTILAAALRHRFVLDGLGEALTSDLVVAHPYLRQVAEFAVHFSRERGALPRDGDWDLWVGSLPENVRGGVVEALGRVRRIDVSAYTPEYLVDGVVDDMRRIATQTAMARMEEAGQPDPVLLRALAERIDAIRPLNLSGLINLRDYDRWVHYHPTMEEVIPSGIARLDRTLGGGFGHELVLVFADSGVGKSIFLPNVGRHAALLGKRVLHISFELADWRTAHRYYRAMAEADRDELREEPGDVAKRVGRWFHMAKGDIFVLYLDAYTTSPSEIKTLVDRFVQVHGPVDLVILDYLDLMAPEKSYKGRGLYEEQARMTHEIRAISTNFDCTTLTASQAVRRANGASRLYQRDLGDSYGKVRGVDILLSLVQTPEEEMVHQGRLGLLKLRDSPGRGTEIPLLMYRDFMVFLDLDTPNAHRIMDKFKINPYTPPAPAAA